MSMIISWYVDKQTAYAHVNSFSDFTRVVQTWLRLRRPLGLCLALLRFPSPLSSPCSRDRSALQRSAVQCSTVPMHTVVPPVCAEWGAPETQRNGTDRTERRIAHRYLSDTPRRTAAHCSAPDDERRGNRVPCRGVARGDRGGMHGATDAMAIQPADERPSSREGGRRR